MSNTPNKIKVLFVITKSNFGGAQKYVYDLATNLSPEKFTVSIALGGSGVLSGMLKESGLRVITIPSLDRDISITKDIASFFSILRLLYKEKPTVAHLNSAKVSGLGALAARIAGVPKIIFTAHGWAFNEDRSFLSRLVIKTLSWVTILLSHKTIAVSDAIKKSTANWPFVKNKIIVIKNGVAEPKFLNREEARKELCSRTGKELPADAFIVGTVAELHKNKGLQYAIEAMAKITPNDPTLYYFIIGGGEEMGNLQAIIRDRNIENRVFLLGFTQNASRFLTAFDIFVLPSLTEALGLVILEAGLAGLPVIATNVGGIPEIIENKQTGLLVPLRDNDSIKESIMLLKNNPSLSKKLGDALKEKVLEEFSFDRTLNATISLY